MKRIFRRLVYAAPALLAFAALAVGAPHQKEPFTLTLQVPKQPLKAGMPLVLRGNHFQLRLRVAAAAQSQPADGGVQAM